MNQNTALLQQRYYVLAAGIFSLTLLLGIARFAFTPLIPVIQQQTLLNHLGAAGTSASAEANNVSH